jgi:hypothetical protein
MIKRDVKLYITKSYVIQTFLCQRMFNPMPQSDEHPKSTGFSR